MDDVQVLLVDDSPPFRRAAEAVLRRTPGFRLVGEAGDGPQALRLVAALRPHLVLMDVRMPGMDGVTATRLVLAACPGTTVVLCSTYDVRDLPEDLGCCGAVAFVAKEELRPSLVRELWDRHRPATPPGARRPG